MRCYLLWQGYSEYPEKVEHQPLNPRPPLDMLSGSALRRSHHGDSTDKLARMSSLIVSQSQLDIFDLT